MWPLVEWHILSVPTKGTGSVHYMNSHLCRRVAGGVQGQAVAAVLFQNREEDSCFCTGWILSMQHSSDRSPEEGVGNREREEKLQEKYNHTFYLLSTACDERLPNLSSLWLKYLRTSWGQCTHD